MRSQGFSKLFILIGSIVLAVSLFEELKNRGINDLEKISIELYKSPEVIYNKQNKSYQIYPNNYGCKFTISGGAFELVDQSNDLKRRIEQLDKGDIIQAFVKSEEISIKHDSRNNVMIYGIIVQGVMVVNPSDSLRIESENRHLVVWVSFGVLLTGLIIRILSKGKFKNVAHNIGLPQHGPSE